MTGITLVLGIVVPNILGLESMLGSENLWPLLAGFILIPACANLCLLAFHESPKYLFINKNDESSALESLKKFRGASNMTLIDRELNSYREERVRLSEQRQFKLVDLFSKTCYTGPLLITVVIQMSMQFSGINAVAFYSADIFLRAGLKGDMPKYCTILLNVIQLSSMFICMVLVEKAGRRSLLIIGMFGMCFASGSLAISLTIIESVNVKLFPLFT